MELMEHCLYIRVRARNNMERNGTLWNSEQEKRLKRMATKKSLCFWESDWGANLNKISLTWKADEFFRDRNVEYIDMKINSTIDAEGNLYQTFIIAYYEIEEA
ncbi:hypothetical protein ACYSNU_04885 [Enterococcus sp. LJL120]